MGFWLMSRMGARFIDRIPGFLAIKADRCFHINCFPEAVF
jgi:hypothetical protein